MLLQSDRGTASWQGTSVALKAPALLWLPNNLDATIEAGAGADGFLLSIDDDFLTKIIAGCAEALHLRRVTDRATLVDGETLAPHLHDVAQSCRAIVTSCARPDLAAAR